MKRIVKIAGIVLLLSLVCGLVGCVPKETEEHSEAAIMGTLEAMTHYKLVIQGNLIKQRTEITLEKK